LERPFWSNWKNKQRKKPCSKKNKPGRVAGHDSSGPIGNALAPPTDLEANNRKGNPWRPEGRLGLQLGGNGSSGEGGKFQDPQGENIVGGFQCTVKGGGRGGNIADRRQRREKGATGPNPQPTKRGFDGAGPKQLVELGPSSGGQFSGFATPRQFPGTRFRTPGFLGGERRAVGTLDGSPCGNERQRAAMERGA